MTPLVACHAWAARAGALAILGVGLACSRQSAPAQSMAHAEGAPPLGPQALAPRGSSAQGAKTAPAPQQTALVLSTALVRHAPSEARFLPVVGKAPRKSNVITTLYRGESVWVRAHGDGFVDVTLSDESHGWVKEDGLLVGEQLQLATVLGRTRMFSRPDLLALHGSHLVEPGTLLIALRHKDQFSEVNFGGQQTAWVLTAMLLTDAQEVGAAKLVHRARMLQARHDDGAEPIIELLRGQFAGTRLFAALQGAAAASLALEPGAGLGAAAITPDAVDNAAAEGGGPQQEGTEQAVPNAPLQPPAALPAAPSLQLSPPPSAVPAQPSGGAPGLQGWQPPTPPDGSTSGPEGAAPPAHDDAFDESFDTGPDATDVP